MAGLNKATIINSVKSSCRDFAVSPDYFVKEHYVMTLTKNGVNQWIRVPDPESRVSARPGWYEISPSVVFYCVGKGL